MVNLCKIEYTSVFDINPDINNKKEIKEEETIIERKVENVQLEISKPIKVKTMAVKAQMPTGDDYQYIK